MSNSIIAIALGIVILFLLIIFLFGLLVIQRIVTTKRRMKIDAHIEAHQEDWYAHLIEGTLDISALAPKNRVEIEAADEVLYRYRQNFNSKQIHYQIFRYIERYLESYYREELNDKSESVRMNTLQRISLYRLQFMASDVLEMASSERSLSKEERLLIYKVIALLYPKEFLDYFINPAIPLGEFDYRRLLTAINEEQLLLLARQYDQLPGVLRRVILDVAGNKYFTSFLPLLESCLTDENVEVRIRALKAIARIDAYPASDVLKDFVLSPIWEERLMVAKVYANAPLEVANLMLIKLLTDQVYQVRKQAARSLHTIRTGDETLQAFIQQSDDKYAIEMATEMAGKE